MSAPLAFIDTETTSLRPDRRAWEVGIIARNPEGHETSHRWFVDANDLDLGNADVKSLEIGRFYERHPQYQLEREASHSETEDEGDVLRMVEAITRGAHLVGAVVSFDADVLGQRMRAHGICPSWHYHLIDVEALAVGYMHGVNSHGHSSVTCAENCIDDNMLPGLPWKSDELTAALSLAPVPEDERHTALGDARWAKRIYDAVMRGAQ